MLALLTFVTMRPNKQDLMALAAPNVKNIIKEQFCSKNIWKFGTKTLPLHRYSLNK
jgi:hypothetical protein